MIFDGKANEYFQIEELDATSKQSLNAHVGNAKDDACKVVIWFQEAGCELLIDTVPYTFKRDQVIFLTEFHMVEVKRMCGLKLLRFNRPFFCISDYDSEAGCRGLLFFGSTGVPSVHLEDGEAGRFKDIWKFFENELHARDSLQLDMLRALVKNLLIIATRIYKVQTNYKAFDQASMDVVRSFNYLVEKHFREKHTVAEYAALLFKSPKTLSNIFSNLGGKAPSQFIYDRIMTEARRMLRYTDKSIGEVGYHLGFTDVQAFSRFFTNNEGVSPTQFREGKFSGNIANSPGKNA
jgi:AraC family transcriptional regulator, transcriptional activator of pobA